jgi:glycosyltransferase involved in cell wall biosynthesis
LPENGLFREKYSIDKNDSIILYLGRIHESKGIQLLLLAFKKLNKEIPKSKLVIVGPDDGFLSEVKKLVSFHEIESNVIFTGPLYEKEKISAYVDADLHVLPRSWEPFGLTLIESCACGTPVICIEGCGISDFVKKSGYVVKYDENEIKTAMVKLLNNKNLIQRIKSEGKLLVNQHYNLSIIVEKLEKIYIDCLE